MSGGLMIVDLNFNLFQSIFYMLLVQKPGRLSWRPNRQAQFKLIVFDVHLLLWLIPLFS